MNSQGPSGSPSDAPVVKEQSTFLTDSEASTLCALFADGLDSGMGYIRIIDMLQRQDFDDKVIDRLRNALIEEGNMLGEAFARFGILDATSRKLLLIAEEQGTLPSTFRHLAEHFAQRVERKKRFLYGLGEPSVLIAVFFVAFNIALLDMEEIAGSPEAMDMLKPALIDGVLQGGIFLSMVVFSGLIFLNLPVDMGLRTTARRLWIGLPIPVFNRAARLGSISMFCRYIQQSISSGLTVHRALALAAEASNNPSLEKGISVAQRAIEEGDTLAAGLTRADCLPDEVIEFIDIGEESGRLEERLDELAERFQDRSEEAFENTRKVMIYAIRIFAILAIMLMLFGAIITMLRENLPI